MVLNGALQEPEDEDERSDLIGSTTKYLAVWIIPRMIATVTEMDTGDALVREFAEITFALNLHVNELPER